MNIQVVKVGSVVCVQLISGLILVGKLSGESGELYTLEKPKAVQLQQQASGLQVGMGDVFLLSSNTEPQPAIIYKSSTIGKPYIPAEPLVAQYLRATSSIQIANSIPQK